MDWEEFNKRRTNYLRKVGRLEPVREGVLTELGQGAALGAVSALRGFASTAEELGGPAGPRKYFDAVLATNQQWNPDPDYTALSLNPANIARAIGTGAGQTATLLPAIAAGTAVGGPVGTGLVGTAVFAQTYGDNLKDYRERFKDRYSENEIRAMSFGRTLVDSIIETGLGNVPLAGKSIRTLINGRAADAVARNAVKEASKKFGKATVLKALNNGFTRAVGKGARDEAGEEALQYIQDLIWRSVAGDPSAVLNWGELAENAAAGAWAGAAFGPVDAGTGRMAQRDRRAAMPSIDVAEAVSPAWMKHYSVKDDSGAELAGLAANAPEGMSPADFTIVQPKSRAAKAVDAIGRELGLDIRYFVPMTENGAALNGVFARDSDAIYLDAAGTSRNPMQSLGHEFAHYLGKQAPDLADAWEQALNSAINPEARAAEETALRETYGELGEAGAEFSADRMGDMFTDPGMWSRAVQLAEAKQAGFGAKLLKVIDRFISAVKRQLVKFKSSEVEKFITDMDAAREAAAGVVAEFKRRQAGMLVPTESTRKYENARESTEAGTPPSFEAFRELRRRQTEEAGRMAEMLAPAEEHGLARTGAEGTDEHGSGADGHRPPKEGTDEHGSGADGHRPPKEGADEHGSGADGHRPPKEGTDGADNIYLRMPLERVRQDAAHGVRLAQEALKEREAQTAPEVKTPEQKSAEPTPISEETQKAANQVFEELANGKKIVVKDDSGVHEYEITRWPGEDEVYSIIAAGDKKRRNKFASRGTVTRLIGILGNKFAVLDKEAESAPRAEPYLTVKYDTPFPYKLNGFYTIEQEIERYQNEIDELKAKGKEAPSGHYKQLKLLKGISEQAKSSYNNAVMQYWSDNDRRTYNEFLERQKQKEIDAAMSESNSEPDKPEPVPAVARLAGVGSTAEIVERLKNGERLTVETKVKTDAGSAENISIYASRRPDGKFSIVTGRGNGADNLTAAQLKKKLDRMKFENQEETSARFEPAESLAKSAKKAEYSLAQKPRQQVNPVLSNEDIRREYAEELGKNTYTPETIAEWDKKAVDWITRQGGVAGAVEAILHDTEHNDRHVASLVRRHVMNSDVFAKLDEDSRAKLETHHAFTGTEWGREGVARRLAALTLDSVAKVRALFDRLHADLPDKEKTELRNKVLDETGVDIFKLPKDIAENRRKLDAVLRSELAARSSRGDRLYEYWINAILSGPATHVRNVVGNTLNTAYELGPRRAVEAAINVAVRNPKGATFGEMREMWKHLDWKTAWDRAVEAFDLEVLNPSGKYNDHAGVAIGGRKGRIIRIPGRLLRAADEFCKGLIAPVEAAAYAYREGRAQKLSGQELTDFITARINDGNSRASQWGELRARELAFQEEPGAAVRWLVSLKNSNSPAGKIARFIFPFVQAPGNLLRQGVRKSPLGMASLLAVDLPRAIRSREVTPEMMARAAEQLIAWSALAALWSAQDGGDDDRPLLTGSGAPYGSNERNFKANKFPPLSVRIGDRYYTYKFFEPLSSGLAVIANGLEAMRAKRPAEVKKALVGMSGFIAEKSYLASVKELFEFFQDPEHSGTRFATNFAASWVPNAYRQAVNAFDDKVRDNRTRARGMKYFTDQFDIVTNSAGFTRALPKLDYFGREVDKDAYADSPAGPLMRLLSVQSAAPDRSMDQADRLLWNYNRRNPESAYWPGLPSYYLKQRDKTLYIEGEDYAAFARDAGQLAHRAILSEIRSGSLNVKNPGEEDIKRIKTLFTKARQTAKEKYKGKFHE